MEEQITGTVLMQRGWKGDRNNGWRDKSKAWEAVTEPGGNEAKVWKG
jgi:hypothetical protein